MVVVALTFDPFREMDRLAAQLLGSTTQARSGPRWMPMDLYRSGDHYVVNVDLPGVDPGSIDLDVDGNTLTVRAQRTLGGEEESAQWLAQERPAGAFMRQLSLGEGLDVDAIHASYENGVLSLTIPVAAQAKPRKIEVQAGGQRAQLGQSGQTIKGEVAQGEAAQGEATPSEATPSEATPSRATGSSGSTS
jgi:HSP20 family protein